MNVTIGDILPHLCEHDVNFLLGPTQYRNVKLDTESFKTISKDNLLKEPDFLQLRIFWPWFYWIAVNMLLNFDEACIFNPLLIVPGIVETATDGLAQLMNRLRPLQQRRTL